MSQRLVVGDMAKVGFRSRQGETKVDGGTDLDTTPLNVTVHTTARIKTQPY